MKKIGRQNPRPLLAWLLVLSLAFAGIPAKAAGAAPASLAQFQPADRAIFVGRPERAALPEGAPALQTHPLSGRVTNGSGNGIEGVTINAIPSHHQIFIPLVQSPTGSSQVSGWTADPRDSGPAPYSTQTDASGAYTFPALPAGTYRVWAEKAGFEFSPASRTVTLPHPAGLDYQILIQPPVIPPTTEVISPETNGHLVSISPDGSQFTFAQTTSELQGLAAGDIMVGAPTRAAPNGYLRRVTKVSTQGGKVIVETGPALLEEAVEDGSLYFQTTLNPADVVSAQALQGVELRQAGAATTFYYEVKDVTIYDNDKNPATKEDQVKANGSIEFELDYEFYLNINNGELQNLTLVEQTSVQDRLEIQSGVSLADLEEEKTLASLDFAPITLQIGEAPVVIAPRLEVVVGADGSVAVGMASSVEHDLTLQAGAGYAGLAGWQPVGEQSHKFTFTPPHATLEASVRGYYSPRLNLYLYGLAGPYVHLNPYLEFKVTPLATPWWVLDGGVDAPVGFKVSEELYGTDQYTGVKLEPYEVMALEIQEILATAQKENQAPYVPSSPAPVHESTNQPLDATLSWTGSDPDGDAVTYDVYLEAGDDSPDVRVSENQPVLTYNPGELQAGTTYYWQIVAKDEHGLSTAGPVWRFSTGEAAIPALPLASGLFHTCAVTETGDVQCWGANPWGQLGDGTNTDRYTPVAVTGLSSGVQALVAGWGHTCALTEAGGVKCWGDNGYGQLGDETNTDHWTPVRVAELSSGVVALAAGGWHTCALTAGGGVKCWGDNIDGQLGDGTNTDRNTPVDVVGLSSGVQALAAGGGHTCALTLGGGVLCWGYNDFGQLGDGTSTNRKTPVNVLGLSNEVMALAAGGGHTCGVTAGGVQCWGDNDYGQLGDGTNTVRNTPVDVTGLSSGVLTLAAGGDHTCALSEVGGVQCWGNNQSGQLGDGTVPWKTTPVDVIGFGPPP